jgi:hypothetical protein
MTKEKKLLTQEQLDAFEKHFEVVETTHDISTYVANFDLYEVNKYEPNEDDNFFLSADWMQKDSEAFSSDGYEIIQKESSESIKGLADLRDVIDFIFYEMNTYI